MIKQSFSEKNIRKIYDLENRKGNNLEKKYFPQVVVLTEKISKTKKKIKEYLRLDRQSQGRLMTLAYYRKNKFSLKKEKEELLTDKLNYIIHNILTSNYQISIKSRKIKNKDVYEANTDVPEVFFLLKQLQFNLRKIYNIKQSNRNLLLSQLKSILSNDFPKIMFKIDIKSFYESIPRSDIIQSVRSDPKLSLQTRETIKYIFTILEKKYKNKTGIPRGIGLSAYLAEKYMSDFDDFFKNHPECSYYSRYVDDIIIIFNPIGTVSNNSSSLNYQKLLNQQLKLKYLDLNPDKITIVDSKHHNQVFDYLGYTFEIKDTVLRTVNLTKKKYDNYVQKIDLCFKSYFKYVNKYPTKAELILKNRLRYLTSNTRLHHNKENVMTGIYFSNKFITNLSQLTNLDNYLLIKINTIPNINFRTQLQLFSFQKGFNDKIYIKFPKENISEIQKLWKYNV